MNRLTDASEYLVETGWPVTGVRDQRSAPIGWIVLTASETRLHEPVDHPGCRASGQPQPACELS
ncbi:hypothetical protein AU187_14260 [Mycobacterium sp. IS-1556]|nr:MULTISPECIES: hypothetical protein [unclassified Mycobacterium]KUH91388.1 hypothetical protein AU185_09585 [Mycobacterium sp. GA-0227b]KUH96357.1 hypothetical protein AU187_14260 [Mycobacterium sp. IS-1556]